MRQQIKDYIYIVKKNEHCKMNVTKWVGWVHWKEQILKKKEQEYHYWLREDTISFLFRKVGHPLEHLLGCRILKWLCRLSRPITLYQKKNLEVVRSNARVFSRLREIELNGWGECIGIRTVIKKELNSGCDVRLASKRGKSRVSMTNVSCLEMLRWHSPPCGWVCLVIEPLPKQCHRHDP